MKKKVLKCIGIVILIVVIIFAINTTRKIIILSKLDKSVSILEDTKDNICIKINNRVDDSKKVETELFIKGKVEKSIINVNNEVKRIQIVYPTERKVFIEANGEKLLNIYKETAPKRTTDLNAASSTHTVIVNYAHSMNLMERLVMALNTTVKSTTIDKKECYELSGKYSPIFLYQEGTIKMLAYVEKNTGLPIKLVEKIEENGAIKEHITEYKVEFDCVTDEDMIEPDVSEYKIQENN